MKSTILNIKKRVLVVETDFEMAAIRNISGDFFPQYEKELICKGSITEDDAKRLVHQSIHTGLFAHYVKDIPVNTYCYVSALDSFISAIEANGYYWGKNPIEEPIMHQLLGADENPNSEEKEWQEAESRTFHPEQVILFEIL